MFCENCGAKNNKSAKFCVKCGYDFKNQKQVVEELNNTVIKNNDNHGPDNNAIASIVLGILSLIIPYVGFILSLFGIVCSKKVKGKSGIATAGLVLSLIALAIWGIALIIWAVSTINPNTGETGETQWSNITTGTIIMK